MILNYVDLDRHATFVRIRRLLRAQELFRGIDTGALDAAFASVHVAGLAARLPACQGRWQKTARQPPGHRTNHFVVASSLWRCRSPDCLVDSDLPGIKLAVQTVLADFFLHACVVCVESRSHRLQQPPIVVIPDYVASM